MNLIVQKTPALSGIANIPSSKSQNIRGLFFALLAKGQSVLHNVLDSEDTRDAIGVCQALGAEIRRAGADLIIDSPGLPLPTVAETIYSGNSGITTHFALPLLGYRWNVDTPITFHCGEQMQARPIKKLTTALTNLGLTIHSLTGTETCPLQVSGHLQGGKTSVDGLSSQYLSALLIALPCAPQDSQITVEDLHERVYAEMTLNWLQEQKINFRHEHSEKKDIVYIQGGQRYQAFQKTLTGDFSSASYLLAAAALSQGVVELHGLDMQDPQGDKCLVAILQEMGADILVEPARIIIRGGRPLQGIRIDVNNIPDLLPTLAVLGACARGKTTLFNIKHVRIKETDRIHSMSQGLTRMGARVEEQGGELSIYQSALIGARVRGFADHRTVMALTVAGLQATGTTIIDDAEAISKTFPSFVAIMQSLGAKIEKP